MKRFFLACLVSLVAISHLMVKPFVPGKKITILVPDAFAAKVFNTCAEC